MRSLFRNMGHQVWLCGQDAELRRVLACLAAALGWQDAGPSNGSGSEPEPSVNGTTAAAAVIALGEAHHALPQHYTGTNEETMKMGRFVGRVSSNGSLNVHYLMGGICR